jgi:hypothetical protein
MMPSTKAQATTDYAAATLNPTGNLAVIGGQQVHIHLTFENVSPDLDGLLTAIETKYGAGKVTSEADSAANARGIMRLRVVA